MPAKPNYFVPFAQVVVTPTLRTSGLLSLLSDRQARLVLALLTFVSPNGQVQATARQVAKALGKPTPLVEWWLLRFSGRRFHDTVFVYRVQQKKGQSIYALSRQMVDREHEPAPIEDRTLRGVATREEVIAQSRARHAHPKSEVEAEVMRQLGHAVEELHDTPEGNVYRQLRILDVAPAVIGYLISTYGVARILQQLKWLPQRRAKKPAHYLMAAIRGDYPAPVQFERTPATDSPDRESGSEKGMHE